MAAFPQTRWTLIHRAAGAPTDEARQALETLCKQYLKPVLAFVRGRVSSHEKAEDIAQGFFAQLIERDLLDRADADRGRFRSFLLKALRDYIADVHDHETAKKRGGGQAVVGFSNDGGQDPGHQQTPEREFELQWVRTVLQRSLFKLREEYRRTNKAELFEELRDFLDSDNKPNTREVADRLNMSEATLRVTLFRMRKQLGKFIRLEIAETVSSSSDVDDELRWLMRTLETTT